MSAWVAAPSARRDGVELSFARALVGQRGVARAGSAREATVVRATRAGVVGWGEASPLEGHGDETLGRSEAALRAALEVIEVPREPLGWATVREALAPAARALDGCPAARFACETLLLSLSATEQRVPVGALLPPGAPRLALGALVPCEPRATLGDRAAALEARGVRTLKLKVWQLEGGVAGLARALDELAKRAPLARVRLDANGACSLAEAALLAAIVDERASMVELVEEPVPTRMLARARLPARVPVALDESLFTGEAEALLRAGHLAVLKPSLLSLARSFELAELAAERVVTHAFEGPIGYAMTRAAAFSLSSPGRAAGLAPYPALDGPEIERASPLGEASHLEPSAAVGLGVALRGSAWR